jgi:hypothetical protein
MRCPNCGGTLELTSKPELFKCGYCSRLSLLYWEGAPTIKPLTGKRKWGANCLRPGSTVNWQGGELLLTDRELVFVPHELNAGPLERAVLLLDSITDLTVKKGFIVDDVFLIDHFGSKWGLRVYDGEGLRDELRRAR